MIALALRSLPVLVSRMLHNGAWALLGGGSSIVRCIEIRSSWPVSFSVSPSSSLLSSTVMTMGLEVWRSPSQQLFPSGVLAVGVLAGRIRDFVRGRASAR